VPCHSRESGNPFSLACSDLDGFPLPDPPIRVGGRLGGNDLIGVLPALRAADRAGPKAAGNMESSDSRQADPEANPWANRETARQAMHMLVGSLALLLRWLGYPAALGLAAGLVALNVFFLHGLPGAARYLYRDDERERLGSAAILSSGIVLYPVSVFVLILLFPLPVAAAMWGVLAFGDGMATVVGSRFGKKGLAWNPAKSFVGMASFVIAGTPAAALLYLWTLPNLGSSPPWWRSAGALDIFASPGILAVCGVSLFAVVVGAFLETLRLPLDDNIVAPLAGACVMTGLLYALGG